MTVSDRVHKIVSGFAETSAPVTDASRFVEDLGADSLGVIEIVLAIEEEFGIKVSDEDAMKIETVGDVVKHLERIKS